MTPGMSAETSLYRSNLVYRTEAATGPAYQRNNVSLAADSCQCTSPNCTWQCPATPAPDPCHSRCQELQGCPRIKCYCLCGGGIWTWVGYENSEHPCGYVCT
jgi:hypothetical protein